MHDRRRTVSRSITGAVEPRQSIEDHAHVRRCVELELDPAVGGGDASETAILLRTDAALCRLLATLEPDGEA
jgi:hypothetical protein